MLGFFDWHELIGLWFPVCGFLSEKSRAPNSIILPLVTPRSCSCSSLLFLSARFGVLAGAVLFPFCAACPSLVRDPVQLGSSRGVTAGMHSDNSNLRAAY